MPSSAGKHSACLPSPSYSALGCDCVRNSCALFKEISLVGYKGLNGDRGKNFLGASLSFRSEIDEKLLKITLKATITQKATFITQKR